MATRDEKIDEMLAKEEIRELGLRYCRAVDRGDMELLESVYHPDALDEHGFNTTNTAREFLDAVPAMRPTMKELQHNITNHRIVVDGDRAEGELYHLAWHRYDEADGEVLLVMGGRYLDKYDKRDGEWRIAHRVCVNDWGVKVPAPQQPDVDMLGEGLPHGSAGTADESYKFFSLLASQQ